jgi:hypothetical protein
MAKQSSGPGEQTQVSVTPELKNLRSRKVYIQLRTPRVRDEIQTLVEQRKKIHDSPHEIGGGSGESRNKNEERIYASFELARLKSELKSLELERGDILTKLRAGKVEAEPTFEAKAGPRQGASVEGPASWWPAKKSDQ